MYLIGYTSVCWGSIHWCIEIEVGMSAALYALGRWCYNHGLRVLVIWLAIAALLGGIGLSIRGQFDNEFEIPGSSSEEALEQLHMTFPTGAALSATAVIVVPEGENVEKLKDKIEPILDEFTDLELVDTVQSPWFEYAKGQISDDGRAALATLSLSVTEVPSLDTLDPIVDVAHHIEQQLPAGTTVTMGGPAFQMELPEISITEVLGVILSFIVLWVMLGSALTAIIPIFTALLGVGMAMFLMFGATSILSVNSVTPMLAIMLGVAVGIDYALFIFSRHRDQLREGMDAEESMARAIGTAGTAVVFAGLTNAIALTGLSITGLPFITVMGVFAAVAVAFAVLIALTLLPAFGGFLGERMRPKAKKTQRTDTQPGSEPGAREAQSQARGTGSASKKKGLFRWWVGTTTSHPITTIIAVVALLGVCTIPAMNLTLSLPNAGQSPATRQARQAYDAIEEHFGPGYNAPLVVTVNIISSTDPLGLLEELSDEIKQVKGIDQIALAVPNQNADTGMIQMFPTTASDDPETVKTVERLRALTDSWAETKDLDANVTGFTAIQLDVTTKLGNAVGPFVTLVVGLTLVLLCAIFRSVWVPIKTAVGFLLSVGASFGISQLVFNEGWFGALINLEKPAAIISFLPILLIGILFGLAMDYEIFIASRIREEYTHGKPARQAIRDGFVASGPVVTAAALVMFAVFAFFVPAGMMAVKQIAFALAIGVLIDAFLVRMTLVPAVLALLGDHAWWMPKWLDTLLPVFDMEGEVLTKQLALANWPGNDALVYAEEIAVEGLVAPVSIEVRPGQVAGMVGPVGARAAAALALSGRLEVASGRGRVVGKLLPEAAGAIRRRTGYVDLAHEPDLIGCLDSLRIHEGCVWFIDGVEAVGKPDERLALQRLAERARNDNNFAVICLAGSEAALTAVTPDDVVRVAEPAHEGSMA